MLDSSTGSAPQFSLGEDQIAVRDMARAFAAEVFAPHAVAWDEAKHFPVAEMRQAAELGMGGVYIAPDVGGSALSRLDATLIFEALATGCPTVSAYMSIHNMAAWMIDAFGSDAQRQTMAAETLHHGTFGELLPDRARRRLGRRGADDARRARWRPLCAQRPEAIHLRRRRRRSLCRDGADRRRRPGRDFDAGRARRHPGPFARRQRAQDGLECAADAGRDLSGRARAGRQPARRGRHRLQDRHGRASTAAGSTLRPARSAARRSALEKSLGLHERAQGLRQTARRIPGAAIPPRRYGDRA